MNTPNVGVNFKLSTYGILEIGEVPKLAFVTNATPKELIKSPNKNTIYRLTKFFFILTLLQVFIDSI